MALTTNNLFTGLYQDTLRAPGSAPWTAGRANCRGYLGVNEEGGNCGQPDVQYFKITDRLFYRCANHGSCHGTPRRMRVFYAVLRDTIKGTPVFAGIGD